MVAKSVKEHPVGKTQRSFLAPSAGFSASRTFPALAPTGGRERIFILHVAVCDGEVVEAVRRLHAGNPKVKLLVVAGACNREMMAALLGVGSSGCLYADWFSVELPAAMRALKNKKKFVSLRFLRENGAPQTPIRKPRARSGTRTPR